MFECYSAQCGVFWGEGGGSGKGGRSSAEKRADEGEESLPLTGPMYIMSEARVRRERTREREKRKKEIQKERRKWKQEKKRKKKDIKDVKQTGREKELKTQTNNHRRSRDGHFHGQCQRCHQPPIR